MRKNFFFNRQNREGNDDRPEKVTGSDSVGIFDKRVDQHWITEKY